MKKIENVVLCEKDNNSKFVMFNIGDKLYEAEVCYYEEGLFSAFQMAIEPFLFRNKLMNGFKSMKFVKRFGKVGCVMSEETNANHLIPNPAMKIYKYKVVIFNYKHKKEMTTVN